MKSASLQTRALMETLNRRGIAADFAQAETLRRVAAVCKALGCHFYHQTDPRGCTLYVSAELLTDSDYNRGIACIAEG